MEWVGSNSNKTRGGKKQDKEIERGGIERDILPDPKHHPLAAEYLIYAMFLSCAVSRSSAGNQCLTSLQSAVVAVPELRRTLVEADRMQVSNPHYQVQSHHHQIYHHSDDGVLYSLGALKFPVQHGAWSLLLRGLLRMILHQTHRTCRNLQPETN